MRGHRFGLTQAVAASVSAAGAATLALRPRRGLIPAAPVNETAYFSASELERARAFQRPRRAIGLADMALTTAMVATVALRPPRLVSGALRRAERRPLAGAAGVSAALSVGLTAASLPLAALSETRARRYGLSTQRWRGWTIDLAKATAIGTALSSAGGAAVLALIRRFPRGWWAPAGAGATVVGGAFTFLAPVLLDPVFNRYTPLPEGSLRSEVLE